MTRKLIALLAVVVMVMSIMATAAIAEETPSWMPEWDMDADVVVVGYGPAGAMAAKAALDEGVSVVVVEKANEALAGGSAATSKGVVSPQTAEQIFKSASGRLTEENAQRIFERENTCLEWMYENGLKLNGIRTEGFGPGFYNVVLKVMEKYNVNVLYETPAKKLIADPMTKEVYGIQCETASGETLSIRANKGVVLCSGNYLGNEDLMTRFHFSEMPEIANAGSPMNTGDGLLMALEIGAGMDGLTNQQIEWYGYAFKKATDEIGTAILHLAGENAPNARIFVNGKGERFMNEEIKIVHGKYQMPFFAYDGTAPNYNGYFNLPMYTIIDSSMFDADAVGPYNYNCGFASNKGVYNWSADNMAELERGWLVKGDTIEELVQKLAEQSGNEMIDAQALKATIETYNAYCEAEEDADYGRNSFLMSPFGEGPYYAAQIVPAAVYTIGGLVGGENGETLDWAGNPIPRLYHAGDIGQPAKLQIAALQGALALGNIAGEACAQLESH